MVVTTPSNNRLRLTPSHSPFLNRPSRSPIRGRPAHDSKLSLKRVVGTTCNSPTAFDTAESSFAYTAGAAVVVVDIEGESYSQRFFRARPSALPVYATSALQSSPSTPTNTTPRANDSRGRAPARHRDSIYASNDPSESPSSRTWTSRERIKAARCLALSPNGRYLAVGETGYAPRVLIFNLRDFSSDTPLVSISEHAFGVKAVAWSADSKFLASLGDANDGFLYIWKIDTRTGSARLFQQNRCTSSIRSMIWRGSSLLTMGVRHVKMWKVEEGPPLSPTKQRSLADATAMLSTPTRTLPGRGVLLGSMLDATFCCAAVDRKNLIFCTEAGDVCILDEEDRQPRMVKVMNIGFSINSIALRQNTAYVGGKGGNLATLDVASVMDGDADSIMVQSQSAEGLNALGFLAERLITIDDRRAIDIWNINYIPGQAEPPTSRISIPGHGDPIVGVQPLLPGNVWDASFLTWSTSGNVNYWDLDGVVKCSTNISMDRIESEDDFDQVNQLTCAVPSNNGELLITADKTGVLKVSDIQRQICLLDTKAHVADCTYISVYESDSRFMIACCGRDRTVQMFNRRSNGIIEHFQTLEFSAKVVQVLLPTEQRMITCCTDRTVQVYDIITKEGDPDIIAAIPSRAISVKASPTSMTWNAEKNSAFVSLLDRSVCQFDLETGKQHNCFKCVDESGVETAVLESLIVGRWPSKDMDFVLGASNTDKSIRIYDANSGSFLDREWGHTEAINGVTLLDDGIGNKKVISVGSDSTIMMWALDLNDPRPPPTTGRDPSPVKEATLGRPALRRVLSKAELAEFQRSQHTPSDRRSPPRTLQRRTSRLTLTQVGASVRTPTATLRESASSSTLNEETPSRRASGDHRQNSPPLSPKSRVARRPSLPALGVTARKKSSSSSLRGFGTLNMSTEQTCRTLRAFRKKLVSAEPISPEVLADLDHELRLTAAALGDRAIRCKAMNETVLSGLLDQYSERLVTLLDEKLRLTCAPKVQEAQSPAEQRSTSGDGVVSSPFP